ncbi:branched-chain amino acid ABC transporter permease [Pseudoroseomonas wenyumeiae]|uniref:Branched-chain amino acid ABC transporter permease n=1 Tax=Teichococcus wenyumeiae TaxID=2478470 RepID=A0A3A9K315_9PROT|nr:branched-chain amino acid ABC transporter permease [Pseudoroseomonas wenyumeiae]RKK05749.1 branched-chain amino acid ABC transporter permease [Pseudoroseomonas wenyumeiae]RMI24963.1 branched-chain amino acid ABC transporter permease [Pseudoroseomonas wenyumeiae]
MTGRLEILAAILGAALLVLLAWAVPWLRFVLTIALAKGITVLGILLLLRAGQVSFGHAMYVAIAAYAVAFVAPQMREALLLLPMAALVSALAGLIIGLFVMRYREIFFGMLNLALSMVFYSLLEKLYTITHGTDGIRLPMPTFLGVELTGASYDWAVFTLALVLAVGFAIFIRIYLAAPLGQALAGIKTREARLEFMGVPARYVLLSAYVLSALMAGCGGSLVALTSRHVTPALAYWTASGELVFIAILGGAGSVLGAFLGAVVYELTRVYAAANLADAWQLILGLVLLLVILFAPGGLVGMARGLLGRRKVA